MGGRGGLGRLARPDDVVRRWITLRRELDASRGPAIHTAGMGVIPSPRCPHCGASATQYRVDVDANAAAPILQGAQVSETDPPPWLAYCAKCERPWLLQFVALPRTGGGTHGREDRLTELAILGRVLDGCRFNHRERRLYLELYLFLDLGCFERVADDANDRWPGMAPAYRGSGPHATRWTRATVRTLVIGSRTRILDRMIAAGLWRHGG